MYQKPNPQAAQQYLKTRVMTATPEQLQLMLYDGALRFGEQGKLALQAKDFENSFKSITKVQNIVMELLGSLKSDLSPELCDNLRSLYKYVYKRLVFSNMKQDIPALEESLKLLRYQRETWALLLQQMSQQKAATAAMSINMPGPDERMEASISLAA